MTTSKIKPTSIRIPEELLDYIDTICTDSGCSRNEYITTVLDEFVQNESDRDNSTKPTITIRDIDEFLVFDCVEGNLYVDGNFYGKCANFKLTNGKVYDESGNLIGQTKASLN